MTAHSAGEALALASLDELLTARLAADDDLDDGWPGTILVEPLTALAGGILGGLLVGALAWRALWHVDRATILELDRRYLRRRR